MLQIGQRRCPALLQHCAAHPAQPWPAQLLGGRQPCQIRRALSHQASAATCTARPRLVCAVASGQQPAAAAGDEGSSDMASSSMASSSTNGSRQRLRRSTRSATASQLPSRTGQPSGGTSLSNEDSDAISSSSSSSSSSTASRQLGLQLLQPGPALPRPLGSLLLQQPQPPLGFAASLWRQQQQWQQQWLPPRQSPQPGSSIVAASAVTLPREAACVSSADSDEEEAEWQLLQELGQLLDGAGIELPALRFGQQRAVCPVCGGGSSREESFAINIDPRGSAVWVCHRATCGVCGGVRATRRAHARASTGRRWPSSSSGGSSSGASKQPPELPDAVARLRPLSSELLAWFASRGISEATLQRNRVAADWRFCRGLGRPAEHIAFPFYREGRVVNIKYRALPKHFSQVTGGEQVFYGLDDAVGAREVIIVEGELDKLAIEEATGSTAVLSVPAGAAAPTSSSSSSFSGGRKFAFVDQAAPLLAGVSRVIVAVDGDDAGLNTALELGRRLGVERCSHVAWPSAAVGGREALELVAAVAADQGVAFDAAAAAQCKDANDMLMHCGEQALRLYLAHAPLPFVPPSA